MMPKHLLNFQGISQFDHKNKMLKSELLFNCTWLLELLWFHACPLCNNQIRETRFGYLNNRLSVQGRFKA